MIKLVTKPKLLTRICMIGPAIKLAKPNPMIARPVANPRLLGKYFTKCERKAPKFIYGDISSLKNNDSISLFFIVLYF